MSEILYPIENVLIDLESIITYIFTLKNIEDIILKEDAYKHLLLLGEWKESFPVPEISMEDIDSVVDLDWNNGDALLAIQIGKTRIICFAWDKNKETYYRLDSTKDTFRSEIPSLKKAIVKLYED